MSAVIKDIMASPAKKWALIISCVAIVVGFIAWVVTLMNGLLDNSGMSNTFNWGLLIAVFAFLVGFGAGSQFVASYIVIANKQDLMPYVKVAQSLALAGGCGAGVAILIDLGNPWHILAMLIGPNPISPLTWDMVTLTLFIVIALVNLILVIRESGALRVWMIIGAISALALQVVEGLLFALIETRVWWHSIVMPVDFLVVAVVCGLAIAAVIMTFTRASYTTEAMLHVARLLMWAIVIHIVLALIDLAIVAFGGSAADAATMAALAGSWWMYVLELGLPIVAAIMLFSASKKAVGQGTFAAGKAVKLVKVAGILTIVGMFFHRLMLLYPAFGSPTLFVGLSNQASPQWALPASTGLFNRIGLAFEMAQGYVPHLMEWACVLLPVGVFVFIALAGACLAKSRRSS